ncbi:hypothetical protein [Microbacterium sp. 2FI]|uniref:hypothetical protein n=1 Tax=Microbacterium sp. 2FI TaxID=2502193 RepID=UPI0010F8A648|nr:hypothetical protein [Microbacterium sp. 2FI]
MSEQGVPREEATAKDFMQVRAALVRRLGGANEALVWTRIDWRAESARTAHQTSDGTHWWAATYPEIAEETGLTAEQARRAVEKLIEGGFLRAEQQHGFARKRSYAPVYSHLADSPDGEDARSKRRVRQIDLADSPDEPLYRDRETETLLAPPEPTATFAEFYLAYPRKVGKEAARRAFDKAVKSVDPRMIVDAAHRYAADPNLPDKQFIPHPSRWLNAGRWDDEPEVPKARVIHAPSMDDFAEGDEWMAFNR